MLVAMQSAQAFCRSTTESLPSGACQDQGLPLLWDRSCLDFSLHASVPVRVPALNDAQVRRIFDASFDAWADVDCGTEPFAVSLVPGTTSVDPVAFEFDVRNEAVLSALTAAEWAEIEQPPTAFAITFVFHDPNSGRIYDVDVALNLGAGPFVECQGDCRDGRVDLQNTLTHEAGHVLGLGHSEVNRATMQNDAVPGQTFMRTLEDDDRAGLCALELPAGPCRAGQCECPAAPVIPQVIRQEQSACAVAGAGTASTHGIGPAHAATLLGTLMAIAVVRRRRRHPARRREHRNEYA